MSDWSRNMWAVVFVLVIGVLTNVSQATDYEIGFSTFLGGADWEHARDVCADAEGNVYIVGGTQSKNFPTTEGAYQREYKEGGMAIGSGGTCEAFVCKFSPEGKLIWSTLLGGPNYDRAYGVEVDREGYVYVCGRGGPGFPVTQGAVQTEFRGSDQGIYGMQNGFITKLKPDGSGLVWSSFVGVNVLCRDLAINDAGEVYLGMCYQGSGPLPPSEWFEGAYQPKPAGGVEIGAMKLAADGKSVKWATWFGGSKDEVNNAGVRIDRNENVYLNFTTSSDDVPTTEGVADRSFNGDKDAFIAKLSPDGKKLIYGTYIGGSGNEEGNGTHYLAVDGSGNAYLVTSTNSQDLPVSKGAIKRLCEGDREIYATKLSPKGEWLAATYIGGSGNEGPDGVYADEEGNVYFSGATDSEDFPVTPGALQKSISAPRDAIFVVLSADFQSLKYSTLIGGKSYDDGRSSFLDERGQFYLTGSTNGPGWPMKNAYQPEFAGGGGGKELCYEGGCFAGDVILIKLVPGR